jgi:hypothetical protein
MRSTDILLSRFPTREDIYRVFATLIFVTYSWTVVLYLWKLPSWLKSLSGGEILTVLAYSLVNPLVESLVVMFLLIVLCVVLPGRYFRDKFTAQGSGIVLVSAFGAGAFTYKINTFYTIPLLAGVAWLSLFILGLWIVCCLIHRVIRLERMLWMFSDRVSVFFAVYVPLGMFSFFYICIRHIKSIL